MQPVTTVIFETFLCDHDFGHPKASYLVVDYAQQCHGTRYRLLQTYAIVCLLIYPIGINALYAWLLLWRYQTEIREGRAEHLAFLFDAYKQRFYYWEIVDNARRLSLTGLLSLFSECSRVFAATLFSLFSLLLYNNTEPFAIGHDNALQEVANAGITFTLVLLLVGRCPLPVLCPHVLGARHEEAAAWADRAEMLLLSVNR